MEFREFENPEQSNYDVKVGTKAPTFPNPTSSDNSLNTDEGVDLNALSDDEFLFPVDKETNPQFSINKFGEIIRDSKLSPTEDGFAEAANDLGNDEPKGMSR